MARVGIEVSADGPLFDTINVSKFVRRAVDEGAVELTTEGASMAYDATPGQSWRGGIRVFNSDKEDMFAWAHHQVYGRGAKGARSTWLERGTRGGVRLRSGRYMFRTAFRRINQVDKAAYFLPRIVDKLNA